MRDISYIKKFLINAGFSLQNNKDSHHFQLHVINYDKKGVIGKDNKPLIINVLLPYKNAKDKIHKYGIIKCSGLNIVAKQSSSFKNTESLDQLFWVIYLLKCGYDPKCIYIEYPYTSGHGNPRIDILIKDEKGIPWTILDAKTRGTQFRNYTKELKQIKGQVPSYFSFNNNIKYVGVVTTTYDNLNNKIAPISHIISTKGWKNSGSFSEFARDNRSKIPLKDSFHFSSKRDPYHSFDYPKTLDELIKISNRTISKSILNEFEDLIRRYGISDKSNAYNKILNLFVAKIYDENMAINSSSDYKLKFVNKHNVTDEGNLNFINRLLDLYISGMKKLIHIKYDDNPINNAVQTIPSKYKRQILKYIKYIRTYSSPVFLFKSVYNKRTYNENEQILRDAVDILERYQFTDPNKQEFLGDFFEGILRNGFQQESGQFFTPIPIGKYIMKSLPIDNVLNRKISHDKLPKMLDFASGSGHFLTTYMQELQKYIDNINLKSKKYKNAEGSLNRIGLNILRWQSRSDKYIWAKDYVDGIELDYRLVKTAKIDTYLNGDGNANIIHANALDNLKYLHSLMNWRGWNPDKNEITYPVYDFIISNPPYSVNYFSENLPNLKKDFPVLGDIVQNEDGNQIELIFIERAIQLLAKNGYLAIVLPASFLSTKGQLYNKARQLFINNFNIKSITFLPKQTFMATGTSTILILAQRRDNDEYNKIQQESKSALLTLLKNNKVTTINKDSDALLQYIKVTFGKNFHKTNYIRLLSCIDSNKKPKVEITSNLSARYCYAHYLKYNFKDVIDEEAKRITTYLLCNHNVIIIKPKSERKRDVKNFLGYTFSRRRGDEGIHPISKDGKIIKDTKLYSDDNNISLSIINRTMFYNRKMKKSFLKSNIPTNIKDLIKYDKLCKFMPFLTFESFNRISENQYNREDLGYSNMAHKIFLLDVIGSKHNIIEGSQISSSKYNIHDNIPVIGGGTSPVGYVAKANDKGTPQKNDQKGIITVARTGTAGVVTYHSNPVFVSERAFAIHVPKDSIYNSLDLYYLLKYKQKDLENKKAGAVQKGISEDDLYFFYLPKFGKNSKKEKNKFINRIKSYIK